MTISTEQVEVITEVEVIPRTSGQDIGNPNPPSFIAPAHEGHKADSDAWTRTKDKRYLRKRAKQSVDKGSTDKYLMNLLVSRRQGR